MQLTSYAIDARGVAARPNLNLQGVLTGAIVMTQV